MPACWRPQKRSGSRLSPEGDRGALEALSDGVRSSPSLGYGCPVPPSPQALAVLPASALAQAAQKDQVVSAPELLTLTRRQRARVSMLASQKSGDSGTARQGYSFSLERQRRA